MRDPAALAWLDPPPAPSVTEARALLVALGALDREGAITEEGKAIRSLALPPRLARMVIDAARRGEAGVAAEVAAVLVERGLGGDGVDLGERVERLAPRSLAARGGGAPPRAPMGRAGAPADRWSATAAVAISPISAG